MEINHIQRGAGSESRPAESTPGTTPVAAGEQVELSDAARAAVMRVDAPLVEAADPRIGEIRDQIARGTYLTSEKLDAAIEALYRDLLGQ